MTTQTIVKKLNHEVEELKDDIREMKKFLFAPFKDSEGEYKTPFVKKLLLRSQSQGPFHRFKNRATFLRHVRSKK